MAISTDDVIIVEHSIQGDRPSMEDAYIIRQSCPELDNGIFLGVFDGHGGREVADYCAANLYDAYAKHPLRLLSPPDAFVEAFLTVDQSLTEKGSVGSTAVVCLILHDRIIAAGAGDSRIVLAANRRAHRLTIDHKPTLPTERARIVAGGHTVYHGRTSGILAVSRSFGDYDLKKVSHSFGMDEPAPLYEQAVSAIPQVDTRFFATPFLPSVAKAKKEDEAEEEKGLPVEGADFVILACDGVWDVMTDQAAVDFVYNGLEKGQSTSQIAKSLTQHCLSSGDNVTVVICLRKDIISR